MSTETATEDETPGWIFGLATAALFVGFVLGSAIAYWSASGYIGMLERTETFYKGKFDYYFDGANKRGYIELCRDSAGDLDVRYVDECVK